MHRFLTITAAASLLAGATISAHAAVTFYTDAGAYAAAVAAAGLTTSSFNFNATPTESYSTAAGLTIDGVNFVGNTGSGGYSLSVAPPYFCCSSYDNPNATLQAPPVSSAFMASRTAPPRSRRRVARRHFPSTPTRSRRAITPIRGMTRSI